MAMRSPVDPTRTRPLAGTSFDDTPGRRRNTSHNEAHHLPAPPPHERRPGARAAQPVSPTCHYNVRDLLKHSARRVQPPPRAPVTDRGPATAGGVADARQPRGGYTRTSTATISTTRRTLPAMNAFGTCGSSGSRATTRCAHGKFFKRVMLPGDVETLAFEEAISIKDFVALHCSHERHFRAWRWTMHKRRFRAGRVRPDQPALRRGAIDRRTATSPAASCSSGSMAYDSRSDMIFGTTCATSGRTWRRKCRSGAARLPRRARRRAARAPQARAASTVRRRSPTTSAVPPAGALPARARRPRLRHAGQAAPPALARGLSGLRPDHAIRVSDGRRRCWRTGSPRKIRCAAS